ncbi:MAG: FAD-binding and (Fe-S)-binding domain-containing protein [Pirellula sp.]
MPNSTDFDALPCEHTLTQLWQRYAFANDAGPYLLIPKAVMQPQSEAEIQSIFRESKRRKIPVTFRAGGTSLSGQSVTDGWLVDIGRHWRAIQPLDNGARVRVQGGAIGGLVNAKLRTFGRKIGPDPSSINSAMIGGMLSNNSSGMCCGVANNAYHTIDTVRFILPDGSVWDTSLAHEAERFEREQSRISNTLVQIRSEILSNAKLVARIRQKYQQKNTVGYSLNAFVDFERPLDILSHLLIGGEGTLAFISEAVLKTLPDQPEKATALTFFSDAHAVCDSIPDLIDVQCDAVEFMDRASLESIRNLEGVPDGLADQLNQHDRLMGLLFEFQAPTKETLRDRIELFHTRCAPGMRSLTSVEFTQDKKKQANLWKLRKGMYPAVAAVRARGEAAILEDVTFPIDKLGSAILELQSLFSKHQYDNGIIFGHARDGNLHFVITQTMESQKDNDRYGRFIDDMVDLVVHRFDGALKAEHGTGRNMAPFVETEWGPEAVALMHRLKKAIDPDGLLNPDVILTSNPKLHLQNIKDLPVVEDVVDKCIECGACEPRCPSRDFTLSPRQRIVLRRARMRFIAEGKLELAKELDREYEFAGKASCSTDGLCAIDCPVAINTGDLIKQLRTEATGATDSRIAMLLAKNFGVAEIAVNKAINYGLFANALVGTKTLRTMTHWMARLFPGFPQWHGGLAEHRGRIDRSSLHAMEESDWIYWPACMSRMMGGTADVLLQVCDRAGVSIAIPNNANGKCCGQAFSSKGYLSAALFKQSELFDAIWDWSKYGERPVVLDLGSCTSFLKAGLKDLDPVRRDRLKKLRIVDSVELAVALLPSLSIKKREDAIAIHSVCSNLKSGLDASMLQVATACSDRIIQPHEGKCCGMGGDRGFELPGLVENAGKEIGPTMEQAICAEGYTNARSCAISLATSSGRPWKSLFHLLEECTRNS